MPGSPAAIVWWGICSSLLAPPNLPEPSNPRSHSRNRTTGLKELPPPKPFSFSELTNGAALGVLCPKALDSFLHLGCLHLSNANTSSVPFAPSSFTLTVGDTNSGGHPALTSAHSLTLPRPASFLLSSSLLSLLKDAEGAREHIKAVSTQHDIPALDTVPRTLLPTPKILLRVLSSPPEH